MSRCKQKIRLCYNRLQFVKETQNLCSIKHRMEIETIYVPRSWSFYLIFTRSYLPVQSLGEGHPVLTELACHLVHVLRDFKRLHDIKKLISCASWVCHGGTSCWCLYFTFLGKVLPLNLWLTNQVSAKNTGMKVSGLITPS